MHYITFNTKIQAMKPNTIRNKETFCPFCDYEHEENVIQKSGDITRVKNMFPTLSNADMSVIIENNECTKNAFNYKIVEYSKILKFAVSQWLDDAQSSKYESAILFKNYGPLSGGSIKHEHMQIIGFYDKDATLDIKLEHVLGRIIVEDEVKVYASDKPFNNFLEYNIEFNSEQFFKLAVYLKLILRYLKKNYKLQEFSYNLFFYQFGERLFVKIIQRYATSPLNIGFNIKQNYSEQNLAIIVQNTQKYIKENLKEVVEDGN